MTKDWEEYEDFVRRVCEELAEGQDITVYPKRKYEGRVSGREIEVEVSFEACLLGAYILGLVECKHYKNPVGADDIEEFHSKINDIGAHKGIVVTTVGYQEGAVKVARGRGIALALLRADKRPDELDYITKSIAGTGERDWVLRGNLRPWGRFSGEDYEPGFRFESPERMIGILAFSMEGQPR